jgi:hypothetical protein
VTIAAVSVDDGVNIIQLDCIGADIQKFYAVDKGNGFNEIRNKYSDKCLDNTLSNIIYPNNVIQWTCNNQTNQALSLQEVVVP